MENGMRDYAAESKEASREDAAKHKVLLAEVDKLFKQKDELAEALRKERQRLLADLESVHQKLKMLGVDVAEEDKEQQDWAAAQYGDDSDARRKQQDANLKNADLPEEKQYRLVFAVLTKRSQKVVALAKKAMVSKSEAFNALKTMHEQGLVKRSGVGAAFWQLV